MTEDIDLQLKDIVEDVHVDSPSGPRSDELKGFVDTTGSLRIYVEFALVKKCTSKSIEVITAKKCVRVRLWTNTCLVTVKHVAVVPGDEPRFGLHLWISQVAADVGQGKRGSQPGIPVALSYAHSNCIDERLHWTAGVLPANTSLNDWQKRHGAGIAPRSSNTGVYGYNAM